MNKTAELSVGQLRRLCDLSQLNFDNTDELGDGMQCLGQERAIGAIEFGIKAAGNGYNLFVLGPAGSRRHALTRKILKEQASREDVPDDWCYVNNFSDPQKPRTLRFPAGVGRAFRDDMHELIEELKVAAPAAFQSEDYRNQRKGIDQQTKKELEQHWAVFERDAAADNITIMHTATGYVLVPTREGKVLSEDEFAALPEEERQETEKSIERLGEKLQTQIEALPRFQRDHRERVKTLDREVVEHAVRLLLHGVTARYSEFPETIKHLEAVYADMIEHANDFRGEDPAPAPFATVDSSKVFSRYEVNLFVSNDPLGSAPVIYETNPTYSNVIGKVEHEAEMGTLVTDFQMIRPGALHLANGGYLVIDALRLAIQPFIWEALKQALFAKSIRIESPGESYGLVSTTGLQPQPIPLDVKIVLIGERMLYYLYSRDSEFQDLFKVPADFDDDVLNSDENAHACAHLVAALAKERQLLPFSRAAVERIVEERSREAGDTGRLSTHMRSLNDLIFQSNFWANQRQGDIVHEDDVEIAIQKKISRLDRVYHRVLDAIERDVLLIDTSGTAVGQINGLSVSQLGDFSFGNPVRITATTRIGTGKVVDIQREVDLGGAIHSKGMMILSSALSARYAQEVPLSLHGSVVFEQTYGGVDGDSASVAEFCALVSSLSGVPIKQCLAVTGSVNQLGRVQVIGGINEKIEGFFKVCKQRGLDGTHGVVMPQENVKHLMLAGEVIDAVNAGQFHVYAVSTIDEAITILTGIKAGQRNDKGKFPKGTVNHKAERQLLRYAQLRVEFGKRK